MALQEWELYGGPFWLFRTASGFTRGLGCSQAFGIQCFRALGFRIQGVIGFGRGSQRFCMFLQALQRFMQFTGLLLRLLLYMAAFALR